MKTYGERTQMAYEKYNSHKKRMRAKIAAAVSACAAAAVFALVLFVPYPEYPAADISGYKNSAYYPVMQKICAATYGDVQKTNNFKKWFSDYFTFKAGCDEPGVTHPTDASPASPAPPTSDPTNSDESNAGTSNQGNGYEEVTDNQVAGVIEGDLFKRTRGNLFYLTYSSAGMNLDIYGIAGINSAKESTVALQPDEGIIYVSAPELYLSGNGNTATVISEVLNKNDSTYYTEIVNVDVSSVANAKISSIKYISGNYVSSRLVNGELLVITSFTISWHPDFSNEKQFIPYTVEDGQAESVPANNIICPDILDNTRYTVICSMNADSLEINSRYAFLSYTNNVYVSENNIFTTRQFYDYNPNPTEHGGRADRTFTEISCIAYNGGNLSYVNSVTLPGSVLNQYSLDERNEVLRAVTTLNYSEKKYYSKDNDSFYYANVINAAIYCVDLKTFTVEGKLESFAPDGESVRSVRFDGNTAFVCTAVVKTDPVFAIDLSTPQNITFKDTGKIPGYSLALRKFYGDTLLGIGVNSSDNLKIEIYREDEDAVKSVAVYEREYESSTDDYFYLSGSNNFSSNYKSYFIDAENGYIGLCIKEYVLAENSEGFTRYSYTCYLLLKFNGEEIELVNLVKTGDAYDNVNLTRATIIDGYLYILNLEGLTVTKVNG